MQTFPRISVPEEVSTALMSCSRRPWFLSPSFVVKWEMRATPPGLCIYYPGTFLGNSGFVEITTVILRNVSPYRGKLATYKSVNMLCRLRLADFANCMLLIHIIPSSVYRAMSSSYKLSLERPLICYMQRNGPVFARVGVGQIASTVAQYHGHGMATVESPFGRLYGIYV